MKALALLLLAMADSEPGWQFYYSSQQTMQGWQDTQKWLNYVRDNHLPDAIGWAQLADAEFRWNCWNTLDNLKRCSSDRDQKAEHAARLRFFLGDANYKAGWMPAVFR